MSTSVFPLALDNDTNLVRVINTDTLTPGVLNPKTDAIEAIEGYLFPGVPVAKGAIMAATAAATLGTVPVGSNGEVLTADSTQAAGVKWAPGGGGGGLAVLAETVITASVAVTGTTEAAANVVATLPSFTFSGAQEVEITFQAIGCTSVSVVLFYLHDDTAGVSLGILGASEGNITNSLTLGTVITPVAGARVYSIRASEAGGAGSVLAGAGGVGVYRAAYARIVG